MYGGKRLPAKDFRLTLVNDDFGGIGGRFEEMGGKRKS
jgi:hypothetical protein